MGLTKALSIPSIVVCSETMLEIQGKGLKKDGLNRFKQTLL